MKYGAIKASLTIALMLVTTVSAHTLDEASIEPTHTQKKADNHSHFQWHINSPTGQLRTSQFITTPELMADFHFQKLTGINRPAISRRQQNQSLSSVSASKPILTTTRQATTIAQYQQLFAGKPIINRPYTMIMDRAFNLIASSGQSASESASAVIDDSSVDALHRTLQTAYHSVTGLTDMTVNTIQTQSADVSLNNQRWQLGHVPRIKQAYFDTGSALVPVAYIEMDLYDSNTKKRHYNQFVIGVKKNIIFESHSLAAHSASFDYRVYGNQDGSPAQGPHGDLLPLMEQPDSEYGFLASLPVVKAPLRSFIAYSQLSTQDPWLDATATTTSGNNVIAFADISAPDGLNDSDVIAETTSDFAFDYEINSFESPLSDQAVKAGIVNLFYVINYLHDYFYDYGFDEVAGNAQLDNYGRIADDINDLRGRDPILAQSQDYSAMNNASMYTPSDGFSPEMQMHLYSISSIDVFSHPEIGQLYNVQPAAFGPQNFAGISGDIARFEINSLGNDNLACSNDNRADGLSGKIVIINRGVCFFTEKVTFAQQAGALAVLIVNNEEGSNIPSPMGGDNDGSITIPSVGLTNQDGTNLYDLLDNGQTVSVSLTSSTRDSAFDNGIVAHEWGHYITNRIIGDGLGLNRLQAQALGEGWADFHSLLLLASAKDAAISGNEQFQAGYTSGTYVEPLYSGIRRVRYSTDMTINPLSFRHIESNAGSDVGIYLTNNASPHDAGEVWASVLWDGYVSLINHHGFAQAKDKMSRYLVDSYKLTPINPTYTEARDALLAAAFSPDDKGDYERFLAAFARRGLGLGAGSPDRDSTTLVGVVESTKTELKAVEHLDYMIQHDVANDDYPACDNDGILDVFESSSLVMKLANGGNSEIDGLTAQVSVVSDHSVLFANNGILTFPKLSQFSQTENVPLVFTLLTGDMASTLQLDVTFSHSDSEVVLPEPVKIALIVNVDYVTNGNSENTQMDNLESLTAEYNWQLAVFSDTEQTSELTTIVAPTDQQLAMGETLGQRVMFLENTDYISDFSVESQPFTVTSNGNFVFSFWHAYDIENLYDGGVIEIKIDQGEWQDAVAAGGIFAVGYDDTIVANDNQALQGRSAFTGAKLLGVNEAISFGDRLAGKTVQMRFRLSSDEFLAEQGWWIDNIKLDGIASPVFFKMVSGETLGCEIPTLLLNIDQSNITTTESEVLSLTATVIGLQQTNSDVTWSQSSGDVSAAITSDGATASIELPAVTKTETITISASATTGETTSTDSIDITILPSLSASISGPDAVNELSTAEFSIDIDGNQNNITYLWQQTSAVAVSLTSTTEQSTTLVVPAVTQQQNVQLTATINNGGQTIQVDKTIVINNDQSLSLNVPTELTVTESQSIVVNATVSGGATDNLTVQWQTNDSLLTISDSTNSGATVSAAAVDSDTTTTLTVTASNGVEVSTATINVNIVNTTNTNNNSNQTDNNSSSGGGSLFYLVLWGLLAVNTQKRIKIRQAVSK